MAAVHEARRLTFRRLEAPRLIGCETGSIDVLQQAFQALPRLLAE